MLEYMAPIVGNPGEYWNYRDESFVGFWAGASHRRGGASGVANDGVELSEQVSRSDSRVNSALKASRSDRRVTSSCSPV